MKRLISFQMIFCLLFMTAVPVYAASGTCEIFYFNECGVGPGGTASIRRSLINMGYSATRYADAHALSVRDTLNADKVFAIISHGVPGRVYCGAGSSLTDLPPGDGSSYNALRSWFSQNDFNNVLLAYYGSCYSAATDFACGNLVTSTTNYFGAKSAIGFYDEVDQETATYYEEQLFLHLRQGYTVGTADSLAKTYTYNHFGYYGDVDSAIISGNSNQKIFNESEASAAGVTVATTADMSKLNGLFGKVDNTYTKISPSIYEATTNMELDAFQDSNYLYLMCANTQMPRMIILMNDTNCPILGKVDSSKTATALVESFARTALPQLFNGNTFDSFCSVYGEGENKIYSVELWESLGNNFYSGNKVAAILSSRGVLKSFVFREETSYNEVGTITSTLSKDNKAISEEKAVDIACTAIRTTAEDLEEIANTSAQVAKNDAIFSDVVFMSANNGDLSVETYQIMVNNTDKQNITTYKEIKDGNACWVIKISNVPTNRFWSIGFTVTINAQTGSVISVSHTR